jgi:hypothetical protein
MQKRKEFGSDRFAIMSFNILRFPSFQSPLVLPNEIKMHHVEKLTELRQKWAPDYTNQTNRLHEFELTQLDRLIEYLQVVDKPHSEGFDIPKLHNDFKKFYTQYDLRRNKSFLQAFPELEEWYETL